MINLETGTTKPISQLPFPLNSNYPGIGSSNFAMVFSFPHVAIILKDKPEWLPFNIGVSRGKKSGKTKHIDAGISVG